MVTLLHPAKVGLIDRLPFHGLASLLLNLHMGVFPHGVLVASVI